jgi:hypothetical protein
MIRAAGSECRSDFRGLPAHAPAVRSLPLAITRAKCVQGLVHPRRWNAFRPSVQGITLNGTGPRPIIATLSQHPGAKQVRAHRLRITDVSTARAVRSAGVAYLPTVVSKNSIQSDSRGQGRGVAVSHREHRRAHGLARLQVSMRLCGVFQRIGLLDLDLDRAREHHPEEILCHRREIGTGGSVGV